MTHAKSGIRHQMRQRRDAMTPAERADRSRLAVERLVNLDEFERATVVGCYLATETEVDTAAIVGAAGAQGKAVCVPAYRRETHDYGLCWYSSGKRTEVGHWGIVEPVDPEWIGRPVDLLIVPGVAFDSLGGRLGHGGGFYDRLAVGKWVREAKRVGLAFSWQIMERVPMCAHDVSMDVVVTEECVVRIGGR